MSYITEGVYLGCLDDAYDKEGLQFYGITHILTLDIKPIHAEATEGFVYKYVHAFDMESQDLLSQLEDCLTFVEEGRKSGGIFVHCHAGRSRSATVVIAYLMRKFDMSLSDTLAMVKKQRSVRPNDGFMSQLELFEAMGNKVDSSCDKYKLYKLNNLADKLRNAQVTDCADSLLVGHMTDDPANIKTGQSEVIYKCRKCRRVLFKKSGILTHSEGIGDAAFDWRAAGLKVSPKAAKSKETEISEHCTQSLFIEPVQWMKNDITQIEGKLSCPKCAAKLGSFNWSGERCPCGSWITPAFHVQKCKVDECAPRQIVQTYGRPGIRTPSQQESRHNETVVK